MRFTLYYSTNVISHRIKLCFMELWLIKTKGEKIIDKFFKIKIKHSSIILMEVLYIINMQFQPMFFIHTLDEWKKSLIHNEDECLHSSPCLFLGLHIWHSFCALFFGFYLHVYKGKGILLFQVLTLGSRLRL
jgi:hypothetical protein